MLTADVISGFVGSVLSPRFDQSVPSPAFHYELWELACSKHRYVAAAAPRGHGKTTGGSFAYILASALFREAKFILIVSDTESQACMFLGNIRQELADNEELQQIFGVKKNEKGLIDFVKETEGDIIVRMNDGHTFRILAKGAEQKLRGLNWNGTRPDLIVCDDLENDEAVMNKDRRDKLRRWFYGALLPCLSPTGKCRVWGTVLHNGSLLEFFMPKEGEKTSIEKGLKLYSTKKIGAWVSVKWKAHNDDFTEFLWPERYDKEFFVEKRNDYIAQGLPDVYSQEFLNRPIDAAYSYFKLKDFVPLTDAEKEKKLVYYITGDLAISENETADYTAFVVGGMDEDRKLHIVEVIRDRLDGREIVDLILQLQRTYDPIAIGLEEMQVTKAIGPFLREEMVLQNVWPQIIKMKHLGKDKIQRSRSIQARMRARTVRFDKDEDWYPSFEDECTKFPRGKWDDQVDAFSYLGMLLDIMIEHPTKQEIEDDEYADELAESGWSNAGRNTTTGY